MQEAVLTHLLDAAPAQFTVEELLRELSSEDPDGGQDAILRAVRDLANVGFAAPSRRVRVPDSCGGLPGGAADDLTRVWPNPNRRPPG